MGNEEYVSMHRRRLLQSAGAMGGLSGLLGADFGTAMASGMQAQEELEEIELVDLADELASELLSRFVTHLEGFFSGLSGQQLIDTFDEIGEYVPGSSQMMGWIEDIQWLYEQGVEFVATLNSARENVEEDESSDGGSGDTDGESKWGTGSTASATSAASTAGSSGAIGGGWGLPDPPSWDDISSDVQSELEGMVDDVQELQEHLPELSPSELIENVVGKLADWLTEPISNLTDLLPEDPLAEPFQLGANFPSFDGLEVNTTFDMPAGTYEIPDGVYGSENGGWSQGSLSARDSTTARKAPADEQRGYYSAPGSNYWVANDPTYWANRASVTPTASESRALRGSQEMVDPLPTMEECPAARGSVVAIPFIFRLFRDPTHSVNAQIGFWVGAEPGRPCLYWADETQVSVGANPVDLYFATQEDGNQLNAAGQQLEGFLTSLSDSLQRVYDEGRDITFRDLRDAVESFLESSIPQMRETLSSIDASLHNVSIDELENELETLAEDLREFVEELADWAMPSQLAELRDAVDAVDSTLDPSGLSELLGILALPAVNSGRVGVDAFKRVSGLTNDLGTWLDELGSDTYQQLQDRVPFDLESFQRRLSDADHPVFQLAEQIGGLARQILEVTLYGMKNEIKSRLSERAPEWEIDLLPDLGCHATCSELFRPASALAWVVQQFIEIGVAFRDLIKSYLTWLPRPLREPVAELIAVLLVVVVVLAIAGVFVGGEAGASVAPGAGHVAFTAVFLIGVFALLQNLPDAIRYYEQ